MSDPAPGTSRDAEFEAFLDRNVNEVVQRGSLGAMVLGFVSAALLALFLALNLVRGLELAAGMAFACGLGALGIYALARKQLLSGWHLYLSHLPFASAPTVFFVIAHFTLPSGAATYITGPFSYLYFIMIAVTAFSMDRRLSWIVGAMSAVGYLACYALAYRELQTISHPDPLMVQDLTQAPVYVFKAMMMFAAGTLAGAVTAFARKLVRRVMDEEQSRAMVNRLFGEYVSDEVREKLLASPGHVQGEKVQVAILFSDLRGFSTFSERHAPEEIVARLNAYFDQMVGAVSRCGGVIDKFIGDAVMSVFGGVVQLESPCDAAFSAAIAMREGLASLNAEWRKRGWEPFDNGVGIDFGEVVLGPLGSARRKDFTVVGDAVNTASRAEGLCKEHGYPIILTEAIYERLSAPNRERCTALGEVMVKGKARPVRIWGARA